MITIFTNARLLDCISDEPEENCSVVVEDNLIKDICPGAHHVSTPAMVIDCQGNTLMPGLIDAHSHYAITTNDMGGVLFENPFFIAIQIKAQLEKIAMAGFTTIRDGGGGHWTHRQAVNDGLILGPRLQICGPLMSGTGGHGDFNLRGALHFPPNPPFLDLMRLVNGPDDCRLAARQQFQKWCDHLKICVTGGCASPNDEAWQVHMTEDEIRAFTEEAKAHGRSVMAHSLNDPGNLLAASYGVDTIEHGSFLSHETIEVMKKNGTSLVATLAVVWWAEEYGRTHGAAEWFLRKLANPRCSPDGASILEGIVRSAKLAKEKGILVGSGADYFGTMCGGEAMNIKLLVDLVGFTPYEALKAATIVNAELMHIKDKTGSIEIGKWADLILVDDEPDDNIDVITQPDHIRVVMREGRFIKKEIN